IRALFCPFCLRDLCRTEAALPKHCRSFLWRATRLGVCVEGSTCAIRQFVAIVFPVRTGVAPGADGRANGFGLSLPYRDSSAVTDTAALEISRRAGVGGWQLFERHLARTESGRAAGSIDNSL